MTARASRRPWIMRVASRPEVGAGHLSRCRALGLSLLSSNPVVMVLDRGGEAWAPRLEADGFAVTIEGKEPLPPWRGVVLDGYDFTTDDAARLKARARPLAVLDDLVDPAPCADLVVNPAPHLEGSELDGIPALLGPRYALLDPGFAELSARPAAATVDHVVVTFGARDSGNATGLVLEALATLAERGLKPRITVVMGGAAPHLETVREAVANMGSRARIKVDANDMPPLLSAADLVIGAGGVGLLERMACGVASLSVATADNQLLAIEGAARRGATAGLAELEGDAVGTLAEAIAALANDRERRAAMAARQQDHD